MFNKYPTQQNYFNRKKGKRDPLRKSISSFKSSKRWKRAAWKLVTVGRLKAALRKRDYRQLEQAVEQVYYLSKIPQNFAFLHLVEMELLLVNLAGLDPHHNPRIVLYALLSLRIMSCDPLSASEIIINPNLARCLKVLIEFEVGYVRGICAAFLCNLFENSFILQPSFHNKDAVRMFLSLVSSKSNESIYIQLRALSVLDEMTHHVDTASELCGLFDLVPKLVPLLLSSDDSGLSVGALRILANLTHAANIDESVLLHLGAYAGLIAKASIVLKDKAQQNMMRMQTEKNKNSITYAKYVTIQELAIECIWFHGTLLPLQNKKHVDPSKSYAELEKMII